MKCFAVVCTVQVTAIVESTEIHLVPCLNPDGQTRAQRHNLRDQDLNRGFPGG